MTRALLPLALLAPLAVAQDDPFRDRPNLFLAREASRWIASAQAETEHGLTWPVVPAEEGTPRHDLYSGTPGVVLFHVELYRASGVEAFLDAARGGADELLHQLDGLYDRVGGGLYTGTAGVGFALEWVHRASGDERYRAGAIRVVDELVARAEADEAGAAWGTSNDVISGRAGIGFFLLWAADAMERPDARATALTVGTELIEAADETAHGLDWPMATGVERRMPNFSHGTAGIAAFLARLSEETDERAPYEAAVRGARHLLAIADKADMKLRLAHHLPGGEDLHYHGWCHGPVGTSRLFDQLARDPAGRGWTVWGARAHAALLDTTLPAERDEGLWETVGPCCGTAGVAMYGVDRFLRTHEVDDRLWAEAYLADVISRAEKGADGWSWPQAEHRVRPELVQAQTGYMQGAAGVGLMLLRFDALQTGRRDVLRLPDDPLVE